jgi:porin
MRNACAAAALVTVLPILPARAEGPLAPHVAYTVDAVSLANAGNRSVSLLDNLDLTLDIDADQLLGTSGTSAFLYVLNNMGARPNDDAQTLSGISNIEVPAPRLRLYEAWIQQQITQTLSARIGLQDLNAEFNATETSDLFLNPSFGISPEFSLTGPSGPSIFPITSLALTIQAKLGEQGYFKLGAFNATAAPLFTHGGERLDDPTGHLLVTEVGISGPFRIGVGAWGYTRKQAIVTWDEADVGRSAGRGVHLLVEGPAMGPQDGRHLRLFLRAGTSWGGTAAVDTAWQTGLLLNQPFAGRPDSQIAVGLHSASLSKAYSRSVEAITAQKTGSEAGFELTVSDKLLPWLSIQPDLQLISIPGGLPIRKPIVSGALRLTAEF